MEFIKLIKNKSKGFLAQLASQFEGLIMVVFLILALLFAGYQLTTSLNNTNATTVWNNTVSGVINFSAQLGTVGTIMGVALIIGVIGLFGYGLVRTRGGSGSGM